MCSGSVNTSRATRTPNQTKSERKLNKKHCVCETRSEHTERHLLLVLYECLFVFLIFLCFRWNECASIRMVQSQKIIEIKLFRQRIEKEWLWKFAKKNETIFFLLFSIIIADWKRFVCRIFCECSTIRYIVCDNVKSEYSLEPTKKQIASEKTNRKEIFKPCRRRRIIYIHSLTRHIQTTSQAKLKERSWRKKERERKQAMNYAQAEEYEREKWK